MFSEKQIALTPKVNEILKELGWEWEPDVGQFFEYKGKVFLIPIDFDMCADGNGHYIVFGKDDQRYYLSDCTPFLHWEIIEEILYELSYETGGPWWATKKSGKDRYEFGIFRTSEKGTLEGHWTGVGEDRQTSVMEAVLYLGNRPCKK